jgi:hypothetical protein
VATAAGFAAIFSTAVSPAAAPTAAPIPYGEARAIVESPPGELPDDLRVIAPAAREDAWPAWVARHNAAIRDRLALGDEDSLVNFWLYGTSFT